MRLILISRVDDERALDYTFSLGNALAAEGQAVAYEMETAQRMGKRGVALEKATADAVVVIGGDGTVLRTVMDRTEQLPIIGINYGEVGFLADLEPDEAAAFLAALASPIPIEQRMRITIARNGESIGEALNEALIVTSRPAKMLRFSILVDGVVAEVFRADGLLISTPTGSTAYAMSAGGPIVDPRIEGFLLVPLAPFMLSSRPHLISCDRTLQIRLESTKPAKLVIDGQKSWDLEGGEVLSVLRSEKPALFIDTGKNFFEKVDAKLRHL